MPIEVSTEIEACDQQEFHALDRRIIGVVFDVHNEFGRLFDVSTTLTPEERRRFRVVESDWVEMNPESRELKAKALELIEDWGAFLDVNLYREALVHFLGGPGKVCQAVEVFSGTRRLGAQNLNLLTQETGFAFTTKSKGVGAMRDHLERLLHHTRLQAIQWINLNRHLAEFTTLSKTRM
jgi:hypothetical protein